MKNSRLFFFTNSRSKITWIICFCIQSITLLFAQQEKFSRVKIYANNAELSQIAAAGVCVDHGEHKPGFWLITEISQHEMQTISQLGIRMDTLVEDVGKLYREQNSLTQKNGFLPVINAAGCNDNCSSWPPPQNFNLGSFAGFFTLQEVMDNLDSMAAKYPTIISSRQSIGNGTTVEGRTIYFVKISDNPAQNEAEPEILYNSLHHAREAQSISQLIYYMWYLLENYGTDPEITSLINQTEMYFVPVVNPDGYVYNYTNSPNGGGMWRKNRRNNNDGTFGVDLNRNYGYNWGYNNTGSSPNTNSDTYRGPSANSEPETQLMENFVNTHEFRVSVNNHTYSDVLIYPFGYAPDLETQDSLQFRTYAQQMTECNGFEYGTPNQTVGYSANGGMDDWLYADTLNHAKIFSFTPEAGAASDGFWPSINRIIPIAQNTMSQNIEAAKAITRYAKAVSSDNLFISSATNQIHYSFKRIGMEPGTFTVSVIPLSSNITSVGNADIFVNPVLLQELTDSLSINLSGVNPGDMVQYLIAVDNGFYTETDTITRYFGTPLTAFNDNCNSLLPQWTSTSWGVSTAQFVSPTGSLTESVSGIYPNNVTRTLTTTNFIDLSDALAARLEFDAKWMIEAQYDFLQAQASTDGINWTTLCGRYTNTGTTYQDPGNPVYDGFQKDWIKEEINLNNYIGQNIKLRYRFRSDNGAGNDGFYLDNVKVEKITAITNGLISENSLQLIRAFPNPVSEFLFLEGAEVINDNRISVEVADISGKKLGNAQVISRDGRRGLEWKWESGFFILKISTENQPLKVIKVIAEK